VHQTHLYEKIAALAALAAVRDSLSHRRLAGIATKVPCMALYTNIYKRLTGTAVSLSGLQLCGS